LRWDRDLFAYALYRALTGVFGLLPEPLMRRTGEGLGWLVSWIAPRKRALLKRHLTRAVGPHGATDAMARRMFMSYGRYWAETFWLRPRRRTSVVATAHIEGIEHIHEARASGRGIVLALPHLGNWEIAGAKAEAIGIPVLAVAESLSNRRITEWFVGVRNQMGIDVVLTGEKGRVTTELMRRLKAGGTIALLSDRDLSGRGVAVDFFGERTTMPAGPVAMADRAGAVLLPVGCFFDEGPGHAFVVRPPLTIPEGDTREARVAAGSQLLAAELEAIIRMHPEQWHLFQPNWPSDREAGFGAAP
jgi:KDO2-lipid IV(A) lauroyltransferase